MRATVDGKDYSYSFGVDTPYPTSSVAQFPNLTASPADYQSLYTLPGVQVPNLTVTTADRDPGAGDLFTTEGPGPGRYGPLIYAPSGRLIWFDQLAPGIVAENLSVQSFGSARDLTFWEGKVLLLGFGEGEDVVMNSHYKTVATVAGGNGLKADLHEFQIEPHDIAYITAYNAIRCDLKPVGGLANAAIIDAAIEEIDMKTGLVRWEWHSLDHVGPGESEFSAPKNSRPWDYFHLNSIDPEPGGDILISARNTWAEYQLAAGTGQILWRLGGLKSSFKLGPGVQTAWQHDARMQPDGQITIFDDGSTPPVHPQSRAVRIALDFSTHQARLVLAYTHPNPPLLGASQGNMQTLPDGNTVVDYGGVPELTEFAKNGSLLFDAHLPYDMASYRGYRYPWSGQPSSPPALAAYLNNTREETILHMSWNGATGRRVLAAARGQEAGVAAIAGEGRRDRLRDLGDPPEELRLRRGPRARRLRPRPGELAGGRRQELPRVAAVISSRTCRRCGTCDASSSCACSSSSSCCSATSRRRTRRSPAPRRTPPGAPGARSVACVVSSAALEELRLHRTRRAGCPRRRCPGATA